MHDHNECKHELKYCALCDIVYCTLCGKEWGGHKHQQYWPWGWYPYPMTTGSYKPETEWHVVCTSDNMSGESFSHRVQDAIRRAL